MIGWHSIGSTAPKKSRINATRWLWHYDHERPNMGLGGITPQQKLAMIA